MGLPTPPRRTRRTHQRPLFYFGKYRPNLSPHRLAVGILREGLTIIPLKMFFNMRGRVKVDIALARGKKLVDKRETIKIRDWNREKSRVLRDRG